MPAALGALLVALALAPSAGAEEIFTSQAAGAKATRSTWAPLPAPRAAVCVIDTGVTPNPDTASVVAREAMDDGDGSDVATDRHGTRMAMMIAAAYNGWGMVGIAPGTPIVSIRARRPDSADVDFDLALTAIQRCQLEAPTYNIRVINMSFGAAGALTSGALAQLDSFVRGARSRGLSLVAAAGNEPGAAEFPAADPPVLSVGAADATGAGCDFSATGGVDLYAPGCMIDAAFPDTGAGAFANGTSEAAAEVSGALAQLYTLDPILTPDQAEQLLLDHAAAAAAGPELDIDATWQATGFNAQLLAGAAAAPRLTPPPGTPPSGTSPPSARPEAWPAPRLRAVRYAHSVLTVTVMRPPHGAHLVARIVIPAGRGRRTRTITLRSRTATVRLRTRSWISATLALVGAGRPTSKPVNVRRVRGRRGLMGR